jgi:hypothetical protein
MGKLLKLRQGVLATGGDERRQLDLLGASLSTLMVIFRAVVRLQGETPSTDNLALSRTVAGYGSFDAGPFERVVRHVRGEQVLAPSAAEAVLAGYLAGMERLVDYLNGLE